MKIFDFSAPSDLPGVSPGAGRRDGVPQTQVLLYCTVLYCTVPQVLLLQLGQHQHSQAIHTCHMNKYKMLHKRI